MSQKKLATQTMTKKSFSYIDLINMKSGTIYSSMGKSIDPQLSSAPRTTFGKQQRSASMKKFEGRQTERALIGREGLGPAAYLPSRHTLPDGKLVQDAKDPAIEAKYETLPAFSIGRQQRKLGQVTTYEHMKHHDDLDVDKADLKRKNSSPNILIGSARRFSRQRLDKITPGPTYDPIDKPEHSRAPKYTMTSRKAPKGQDPIIPPTSTTTLVGPGSYFQKVQRSNSTSSLSRVPYDSKINKQPVISFAKAPRTLKDLRNSVDETYDIKSKTIMAQYDFEYDGGKGYQSGKSFMKSNIVNSAHNPLEKNKMGSFTMTRTSRQKEQTKRGVFKDTMSQIPQTVRIQIPKF